MTESSENTMQEYGTFRCRVCGDTVFFPLPIETVENGGTPYSRVELTCTKGHTDAFELSQLKSLTPGPQAELQVRHAAAGVG